MTTTATTSDRHPDHRRPLYVYEAPVRIWHWVHATCIFCLMITGFLIANPLPSVGGEASDHFLLGTIRMIHFIAAYVFMIGFLVRFYWALVGNKYARELFFASCLQAWWWKDWWHEFKYYTFLTRKVAKPPAHTAFAAMAVWVFNVVLVLFMIFTGLSLYSQGLGAGSWADKVAGWVFLLGSSQEIRMWHLTGMWLMLAFVVVHLYMVIRADIMGRQSSISTMISGWRTYRDDLPPDPR